MRPETCTAEEARRRSAQCQRQRQRLLRAAVENSTNRWAQQVFSARFSLSELARLWRQQTGGACDFEVFAQRAVRESRSRLRAPSGTSVGSSRRSASEPRHRHAAPAPARAAAAGAAPPGHRKRRHSIAIPLLPAALYCPYVYVAHHISQRVVHARVAADEIHRAESPECVGQQPQPCYPGARVAEGTRPLHVVSHAVPLLLLCNVGIPADAQWAASFATPRRSASRGQTADKYTQTEHDYSPDCADCLRRSPVAPPAARDSHSRTRTLPGNFAELQKTWDSNDGSPIKSPSRNIRL